MTENSPSLSESLPTKKTLEEAIHKLAVLPMQEYKRKSKDAAKILWEDPETLDKLVAERRKQILGDEQSSSSGANESLAGSQIQLETPVLWHEPVNGPEMMDELLALISKYLHVTEEQAIAIGLWAIHTYAFKDFEITPRLSVQAPTKQCGKTQVLKVLLCICNKPIMSGNITPAATFRFIEEQRPTLLLDEFDNVSPDNKAIIGVVSTGHEKHGSSIRLVGDDHSPRAFSTFAPLAMALIGSPPPTIADRSIAIEMTRRPRMVTIAKLRRAGRDELKKFARMIARWVDDSREKIVSTTPLIPDELNDRQADGWEILLAIAEAIGPSFAENARNAAIKLSKNGSPDDEGIRLLRDIRTVMRIDGAEAMPTEIVVKRLNANVDWEWADRRNGRGLNTRDLSNILRPYGVPRPPVKLRYDGGHQHNSLRLEDLLPIWNSYLEPEKVGIDSGGGESADVPSVPSVPTSQECEVDSEELLNLNHEEALLRTVDENGFEKKIT